MFTYSLVFSDSSLSLSGKGSGHTISGEFSHSLGFLSVKLLGLDKFVAALDGKNGLDEGKRERNDDLL